MRKLLFLIVLLIPFNVMAENKYIYDVLKDAAENGTLAKEYTREHQDTTDDSGTEKIYHWFATNDDTASSINEKRNVIFGGFCWQMIRTTDSGGVRLLYNGTVTDGKCLGYDPIPGSANFSTYDDLYTMGSAGYMHNELYETWKYITPAYGSYTVSGTKLTQDEYNVISNTGTPYTFSTSYGWQSGKVNNYTKEGIIEFSVKEDGDYGLYFYFSRDYYYDSVMIYKNNELINIVRHYNDSKYDTIPLNDLKTDDVIKVETDLSGSDNHSTFRFYLLKPTGTPNDTRSYFGNSVKYENGTYTLQDTIRSDGTYDLAHHHYFCEDGSISCEKVYYAMNWYSPQTTSWGMEKGLTIESYVHNQLYADDVNKYDSDLKSKIDTWYENNLLDYGIYLEDTVFCQNRNIAYENSTLNPNGGNPGGGSPKLYFFKENSYGDTAESESYLYNTNLKCSNETDRFSTSNEKAKLKYPVATINLAESLLLANSFYDNYGGKVRSYYNSGSYWLISPYSIAVSTYGWGLSNSGGIYYSYGANTNGYRPMVSLKKGTRYIQGDGSKNNPYVIKEYHWSDITITNDDEKGKVTIELDETEDVLDETPVPFLVQPKDGYIIEKIEVLDANNNPIEYTKTNKLNEYEFLMPESNTTIKGTYKKAEKEYKFVSGVWQIYNPTKEDDLKFGLDAEQEELENNSEVYIDNNLVDPDDYIIGSNSTIQFDNEFARKLEEGEHTITVIIDGVYQVTTYFNVSSKSNPDTSDKIVTGIIIGFVSLFIIITFVNIKRKGIIKYKSFE